MDASSSASRFFHVRGRLVDEQGEPRAHLFVALADRDALFDDLLGTGWADEDGVFQLSFPREAFNLEPLELERTPELYVVVSEGEHRGALTPVIRHEVSGAEPVAGKVDLGAVVVPATRPANAPAAPIPGPRRYRPRLLHLDAELIDAALEEMAPRVEALTGWSGLLDDVAVTFDDAGDADAHRAALIARASLPPEAQAWLARAGTTRDADDVLASFDVFTKRLVFRRALLGRGTYEQLKRTVAHELVHVGQFRHHPALLEEKCRLLREVYAHHQTFIREGAGGMEAAFRDWAAARWKSSAKSYFDFHREARARQQHLDEAWFGFTANVESYAAYIERFHIAQPGDCAVAQFDESLATFLSGVLRLAPPDALIGPPVGRQVVEETRDVYAALVPAYQAAQGENARPAPFDPLLCPPPPPTAAEPEQA